MRRSVLTILVAAVGIAGFTACDSERAIATDPIGAPAYGIRFVSAGTNIPRGTVTFAVPGGGARDQIRLTLAGLDSLAGNARYVLWVTDSSRSSFRRMTSRITMTIADTSINAQGDPQEVTRTVTFDSTSSFSNGGSNRSFSIVANFPSAFAAGVRPDLVLVTIEDAATATTPSVSRRPLWAQRTQYTTAATAANNTGTVRFGYWSAASDSLYVYPLGTQRGRAMFRGNVLMVNDSSLPRPPRGYFYATYLIKRADDNNAPVDTVYLGPQTSPAPRRELSLRHADSVVVDPLVQLNTPPQILAASARIEADTTGGLDVNAAFRGVADVLVTLELKSYKVDEGRMGPAIILRADVPTIVRNGPR
jgi:hypothetical protein